MSTKACLAALGICVAFGCSKQQPAEGEGPRTHTIPAPAPGSPTLAMKGSLAEMRAALDEMYRLPPDRRLLDAFRHVTALVTGTPSSPVEAKYQNDSWRLTQDGTEIGVLPRWPDFDDVLPLLVSTARKALAGKPLPDVEAPVGDVTTALVPAETVIERLRSLDSAWKESRSSRLLGPATAAAATLLFELVDDLDVADGLAAHALALAALSAAVAPEGSDGGLRAEALLAEAMGYGRAAQARAAKLPEDDPLRSYIKRDDDRLAEIAGRDDSSFEARYLHLLRLIAHGQTNDEETWRREKLADESTWLTVTMARMRDCKSWAKEDAVRALPMMLAMYLQAVPDTGTAAADGGNGTAPPATELAGVEAALLAMGEADPASLCGPGFLAGALGAALYSAAYQEATFLVSVLSSEDAAREQLGQIAALRGPTAVALGAWLDLWINADFGKTGARQAADALAGLVGVPPRPLHALWNTLKDRLEFMDPGLAIASAGVARRMDSRTGYRCRLENIVDKGLYDTGMSEELLSSVIMAAGTEASCAGVRFAVMSDDRAGMLEALNDPSVEPSDQEWIVEIMAYRKELTESEVRQRIEAIAAQRPDDWRVRARCVDFLVKQKDYEGARNLAQDWLDRYGATATGLDPQTARAKISANYRRQGRFAEALATVEPVARSSYASIFRELALSYCALGRADEAQAKAAASLRRYPNTVHCWSLQARVNWCLGRYEDAAKILASPPMPLTNDDWRDSVGDDFVWAFKRASDEEAMKAFEALWQARVASDGLVAFALDMARDDRPRLAINMYSRLELTGLLKLKVVVDIYKRQKPLDGEEAALAALLVRVTPDERSGGLGLLAFNDGAVDELLWTAVPDPTDRGPIAEANWMMRAAAAVRGEIPVDRRQALDKHFRGDGGTYYHTIGRYLLDQASEADVLALATDAHKATEVGYYVGLKAAAKKRYDEATDWYRVVVELGQTHDGEYQWALTQLANWRNEFLFPSARARSQL